MASPKERPNYIVLSIDDRYSIRFHVIMIGPHDTPYEDGLFRLDLKYQKDDVDLLKQPGIYFRTQIYHPNINSYGEIYYSDIVKTEQYNWSINNILLTITSLLYEPNTFGFLVPEAAYLFKHDREKFNQRAKDWTMKYAIQTSLNEVENTISDTEIKQVVSKYATKKYTHVSWLWKLNENDKWNFYSDIENERLEKGYQDKEKTIKLDGFIVDLKNETQTAINSGLVSVICRCVDDQLIIYRRRERFTDTEKLSVGTSFIDGESERLPIMIKKCFEMKKLIEERLNTAHSYLIFNEDDLRFMFKILYWFRYKTGKANDKYTVELEQLMDEDTKIYRGTEIMSTDLFEYMYNTINNQEFLNNQEFIYAFTGLNMDSQINILERLNQEMPKFCDPLINGIEYEWQRSAKSNDDTEMIRKLKMTNNSEYCVHMYTRDSFLYRRVNEFLRKDDRRSLLTLSLYVCELFEFFNANQHLSPDDGLEVYRAVDLSPLVINDYRKAIKTNSYRWLSFSSATRCRTLAEFYNRNTILIMRLKKVFNLDTRAIDISTLSQFPEEQEILLKPGTEFTIEQVEYHDNSERHHIHLNVYF